MITDFKTLFINELISFRLTKEYIFVFLIAVIGIWMFVYDQGKSALIGTTLMIGIAPVYFGALYALCFVGEGFKKERQYNILDTILISGISEWSLLLSKVIIPIIISYIITLITIISMSYGLPSRHFIFLDFILPVIVSYCVCVYTLFIHIIVNNDKHAPACTFFSIGAISFILYQIYRLFPVDPYLFALFTGLLLSIVVSLLTIRVIRNISHYIKM